MNRIWRSLFLVLKGMDIVRELKFTSEHMYASVLKWKAIQREILSNNSILENADRKNLYGQVRTINSKMKDIFPPLKYFSQLFKKKFRMERKLPTMRGRIKTAPPTGGSMFINWRWKWRKGLSQYSSGCWSLVWVDKLGWLSYFLPWCLWRYQKGLDLIII